MSHRIVLLPGDGIGPEVTEATVEVLEATGVAFDWIRHEKIGVAGIRRFQSTWWTPSAVRALP